MGNASSESRIDPMQASPSDNHLSDGAFIHAEAVSTASFGHKLRRAHGTRSAQRRLASDPQRPKPSSMIHNLFSDSVRRLSELQQRPHSEDDTASI